MFGKKNLDDKQRSPLSISVNADDKCGLPLSVVFKKWQRWIGWTILSDRAPKSNGNGFYNKVRVFTKTVTKRLPLFRKKTNKRALKWKKALLDFVWLRVLQGQWAVRLWQWPHTGLGSRGLNVNSGSLHWQQHGHMHGHWHIPFGGFSLQHSQPGLFTLAPNRHGNVRPEQHPQPPPQPMGGPNPPQQLLHIVPSAQQSLKPPKPPKPPPKPKPCPQWRLTVKKKKRKGARECLWAVVQISD